MVQANGDETPVDRFVQAMKGTIHGKIHTIPASANSLLVKELSGVTTDLTKNDIFKNSVMIFTTGNMEGQRIGITASAGNSADPYVFTVSDIANYADIAVDDEFTIV